MVDVCAWSGESPTGTERCTWGDCAESDDEIYLWNSDRVPGRSSQHGNYNQDLRSEHKSNATPTSNGNQHNGGQHHFSTNSPVTHGLKLFVGGLPSTCTKDDLRDYFAKFGYLVDCVVMFDKDNRHRGFGFVTYSKASEKNSVMATYDKHFINNKWVEVKECIPKQDMEAQNTGYKNGSNGNSKSGNGSMNGNRNGQKLHHKNVKTGHPLDSPSHNGGRMDSGEDRRQSCIMEKVFSSITELSEAHEHIAEKILRLKNNRPYGQKMEQEQDDQLGQYYDSFEHYHSRTPISTMNSMSVDGMDSMEMSAEVMKMWMPCSPMADCVQMPNYFGDSPLGSPRV